MDNLACALLLAESMLAEREALWSGPDRPTALRFPPPGRTPLPTLPIESMNVWAFLYTQCSRLPAPVVALLILAGLAGLGVVLSLAGSAVAAATVGAATGVLFKKVSSRLVG